ncbi:MAG: cohesin domain-containing protein [Candidatus Bathyarchaeota archaeon]|nr:cohesin domain-containing protein [Candidatus Bathyarchaeota archaeon]
MNKKYLALAIIIMLVCSISLELIANAQTTTVLSLTPSTISTQGLSIGSTFDVVVHIDNVQNLWQWVFSLSWDPAVLTVPGNVVEGQFLKSVGTTFFVTSPKVMINSGILNETTCTLMLLGGASGSGDLAKITFKVVGYGSTKINFETAALGGVPPDVSSESPPLTFTSVGCTFNLPDPNQPTPSPTPTSSPLPTPSQSGAYGPTALFLPVDGSYYSLGSTVVLDASQSTPGFDTAGKNESCPITNYAWRIEFPNGTALLTLSGKIVSFNATAESALRIILIVTAPDPTLPSAADYFDAASKSIYIQVQSGSAGAIDIFLDRGGKGQLASSGPYGPQELINLSALVTYRNASVMNQDVVFTVYDGQKSIVAVRSARTGSDGLATAQFRLPWPNTSTPQSVFGNWSISATVNLADSILNDTVAFTYNYIITSKNIQPPATVHRSENATINITISSINNLPLSSTVVVTIYDSQKVPIGSYLISKTVQASGVTIFAQTITIPTWAYLGQATIYLNILTDTVENGGLPYCPEATSNFTIQ